MVEEARGDTKRRLGKRIRLEVSGAGDMERIGR
jgi:hypothetical protein